MEGEGEVGAVQESLPPHSSAMPSASMECLPAKEKIHLRLLSEYLVRGAALRKRLFATTYICDL